MAERTAERERAARERAAAIAAERARELFRAEHEGHQVTREPAPDWFRGCYGDEYLEVCDCGITLNWPMAAI